MQLKYNNYVRSNVVYIDLETVNFTTREEKAFMKFGEPVVAFHEGYEGNGADPEVFKFRVDFERRIKTSFKVRAKFDGSGTDADMQKAVDSANLFFDQVKEKLENEMSAVMLRLDDLEVDFISGEGLIDIVYA